MLNLIISTSKVPVNQVSISCEEFYYIITAITREIIKLRETSEAMLESKDNTQQLCNEIKSPKPKLPPINIPVFKGYFEKFRSLCDTLVHKTDLSPIQKFLF